MEGNIFCIISNTRLACMSRQARFFRQVSHFPLLESLVTQPIEKMSIFADTLTFFLMPQIIYNVTSSIDDAVVAEWITWMRATHIPEVMQTGLFLDYKFLRVIGPLGEEDTGSTYAVQYILPDIESFLKYKDEFAPALQAKTAQRYGERVHSFRTLLEVVA